MLADLHIHSVYSDGTLTPEEIVAQALQNGVGLLAVCDHNVVAGSIAAAPLARAAGLEFLSGVELDTMLLGTDTHILCYGADLSDEPLLACVRDARARMDWMSDELFRRMQPDYPALDPAEYADLPMDSALGGWKFLQYLYKKGVTRRLRDGFRFYGDYGVGYETAGFRPAGDVIAAIHAAGGCAVLAHPGVTFEGDPGRIARGLREALDCGIDGVECFYPKHSPELTQSLLAFCAENALSATAGSDCHGAFGSASVGETQTPAAALTLLHKSLH